MLIATGMVALVVTMILEDGTHIAQPVNVLNHQLQPLQPQPQQPQQPQQPLQLQQQQQLQQQRQLQPLQQLQQPLQFQQPNLLHLESVVRSNKSQNFAILQLSILKYVTSYLQLICHPS
jgi:hypothetical protein